MTYENFPRELAVIVEDELFLYPFMITPIFLSDENNLAAIEFAEANSNNTIMIVPSKSEKAGARDFESIFDAGVMGTIMRKIPLPDGRVKILFQGSLKAKLLKQTGIQPLRCEVEPLEIKFLTGNKAEALVSVLKERVKKLGALSHYFTNDFLKTLDDSNDIERICDLVSSALHLKKQTAYEFFIQTDMEKRITSLIEYIMEEIETFKIEKEIKNKVHSKIDKSNKEYFLKEQLKQIQQELGENSDRNAEIEEYRAKLKVKKPYMNEDAYKEINKQIEKLSRLHPDSADASMVQSYLDWVIDIPFERISKKKSSIDEVSKQLNHDHCALKKPKERIEEYFALKEFLERRGLNDKINNSVILCFAGPPGVGKTSLANSIATALKRELVRIALGGLEDVNELRGHRRTYIGAMPGRIVQGLIETKQMNPVMVLDEIDKVSQSYRGDPTAALLEILDPEQNNAFRDYYLNFNIDLSKVIFIATANDISTIPPALRDRMEFIFLSSYTPQEKYKIAKNFLLPQELKKHGLKANEISISPMALKQIIEEYTRESGVRNLRRKIADILRKSAMMLLKNPDISKVNITSKNIKDFLDKKVFEIDSVDKTDQVGIVNGLAWTVVGGDVLKVEAVKILGKGNMTLTGQLGDVMKESVDIAYSVIKTIIDSNKIKVPSSEIPRLEEDKKAPSASQCYRRFDLHIHVPEGATPKDGPSAGITMATAIASVLTNSKVRHDLAMTGEITLSGKVLAIGGLKEKLIAAHRAKIKTVLIPRKNYEVDLDEIPDEVKKEMKILPVDRIEDVLKLALV